MKILTILISAMMLITSAYAMDAQQIVQDRGNEILDMLGPSGLFAIAGSIVIVRAIRVLWCFTKRWSFITAMIVSAIIGAGSTWAGAGVDNYSGIIGGAFICMIGTPIAYEIIKWVLAFAYQHTKWKVWKSLYFFMCPKPLKEEGDHDYDPDGELTKFFNDDKTEFRK
jgi:hypothetical protein